MSTFDYTVLDRAIEEFGNAESSLISILQSAQEHYRYLPREVFPYLAEKLNISEAKIYGVATFYENFSLEQKGKYVIKEGTVGIADHAFDGCTNLTNIKIPNSLKYIGDRSFDTGRCKICFDFPHFYQCL